MLLRYKLALAICIIFVFSTTSALIFLEIKYGVLTMARDKGVVNTSEWVMGKIKKRLLALSEVPNQAPKGAYFSSKNDNYWAKENPKARAALPPYKTIKAISASQYPEPMPLDWTQFSSWSRSHGDDYNSKFSVLDEITKDNVQHLERAWVYNSGEGDWKCCGKLPKINVETNPIFINGVLYTTTPNSHVVAIDARTGKEKWRFRSVGIPARRGMVWWLGDKQHKPRIYLPIGERLYALDPETGHPVQGFGEEGFVKIPKTFVAPIIDQDRVIVATFSPSVEAFDVLSGKRIWQRPLLEKKDKLPGNAGPFVLDGGAVWAGMALDKNRNLVFVSTGDARQSLYGALRPGNNEHANSIVAINSLTGEIVWSFQEIHHDIWDMDIPSPPALTTITKDGRKVDVVVAVTKLGNTLVLDRESGRPIFDFKLKRAPVSQTPGEKTAPYQPQLELPEPFSKLVFTKDDVTNIGWANKLEVTEILKNARHGFFQPPSVGRMTAMFGIAGGAQWPGVAIDHRKGIMYIPSNQIPYVVYLNYQNQKGIDLDMPGKAIYDSQCASCHGKNRDGIPLSNLDDGKEEVVCGSCHYVTEEQKRLKKAPHPFPPPKNNGKLPIPSIGGITLVESVETLKDFKRFGAVHDGLKVANETNPEGLDSVIDYFLAVDKEIDSQGGFSVSHMWKSIFDSEQYPGSKPPWGLLTALDLATGKIRWQVPFGEYDELTARGIPVTGQPNFGGVVVTTGGLIFATGTSDNKIRAFDADTGVVLWEDKMSAAGSAPPLTYELDGVQYVTVVATGSRFRGFDHSDALITYRLGKQIKATVQ